VKLARLTDPMPLPATEQEVVAALAMALVPCPVWWGYAPAEDVETPPSLPLVVVVRSSAIVRTDWADMCEEPPADATPADLTLQIRAWHPNYGEARALQRSDPRDAALARRLGRAGGVRRPRRGLCAPGSSRRTGSPSRPCWTEGARSGPRHPPHENRRPGWRPGRPARDAAPGDQRAVSRGRPHHPARDDAARYAATDQHRQPAAARRGGRAVGQAGHPGREAHGRHLRRRARRRRDAPRGVRARERHRAHDDGALRGAVGHHRPLAVGARDEGRLPARDEREPAR
jgi:hypothetical protein